MVSLARHENVWKRLARVRVLSQSFRFWMTGLILNNYSTGDSLMSVARIAVTISIIASYPLIFVGARDGLFDLFKISQDKRTNKLQNKMTFGILGLVTLLASRLTDLGLVASVGGATFGTALVFVYPVIMFLKQQKKRTRETIPAALIGVLGLCMGAIGTALSFR
jgi:amino acid permease